jgi:hypothetical protein
MATYLADHVRQQLQEELERHLVTGLDGRCTACGDPEPCRRRYELSAAFFACGVLPRRRPSTDAAGTASRTTGQGQTTSAAWFWWSRNT